MSAPESVKHLIDTFGNNIDFYKSGEYNEAQLRKEFLDPFFKELGWDMDNAAGLAPQYRDVIHEASIKTGSSTKAPDYAFTIHGQRKFFLEAKKPAINVRDNTEPAYQLRRYGWSAKLPISILTDFEEFAIYDCRKRPKSGEATSISRLDYFKYTDYIEKWSELCATFSKNAILKGSFDKYTTDAKRHRGTETVDDAFLAEIEKWRNLLARNFALRNPTLSVRDLNFAVQKTIDRIIFLRICEDRGTEDYQRLASLLNGEHTYPRLLEQFKHADARYNSGLFHFSHEIGRGAPDNITPGLVLDNKILKEIISKLYYPESPYEFSVLPADILGQIYEQFLGKTIRLTEGHQAKIEKRPEVRKAGGVYYTPGYIVDYIVANTLGRKLNGNDPKNPKPITVSNAAEIKIVDPACGSGSFLIIAYQHLLDWHLRQYTTNSKTNEPDKGRIKKHSGGKTPRIYRTSHGEWKLTTDERKRILLCNIFGVDIDAQAVEVTKLSLLLKVVEGESHQTDWVRQRQRVLPDLGDNIKCGNSLIGSDFYDNEQALLFDEETQYRINVFDWQRGFPGIMQRDGFDCIIGNPPYLAGRIWTDDLRTQRFYFEFHYTEFKDQYDLYALFIERAVRLLNNNGCLGFITPNTWFNNSRYISLRRWLFKKGNPYLIGDYREVKVFPDATVLPTVFVFDRAKEPAPSKPCQIERFYDSVTSTTFQTSVAIWDTFPGSIINLAVSKDDLPLLKKIEDNPFLEEIADCRFGVKVYQKGKGTPPQAGHEAEDKVFENENKISENYLPYARGKSISNWTVKFPLTWLHYGRHLAEPRSLNLFTGPRIFLRRIVGERLILVPIQEKIIADQLLHTIKPYSSSNSSDTFLVLAGILSSKLIAYYFRKRFNRTESTFPEIRISELKTLPIHPIDFANPNDVAKHDKMITLVEGMLSLHKKKADEKNPETLHYIETRITITDRQIDRLVYDLYNLSAEEIALIESNMPPCNESTETKNLLEIVHE